VTGTLVVELRGGLGNQLFQFAAAKGLQGDPTEPVVVDDRRSMEWPNRLGGVLRDGATRPATQAELWALGQAPRLPMLQRTAIRARSAMAARAPNRFGSREVVEADRVGFDPDVVTAAARGSALLRGYFQSEDYFAARAAEVYASFAPPPRSVAPVRAELDEWAEPGATLVGISLRTGADYQSFGVVLPPSYYDDAIARVEARVERPAFVVFGDEAEAADALAAALPLARSVATAPPDAQLHLLAGLPTMVASNSSFAWWAAWLGDQLQADGDADHVVFVPRPWLHEEDRPTPARWTAVDRAPSPSAPVDTRVLAFYLPQFHPVAENDDWWGPGFTEWTNTAAGRPLFPGHYQPHVPADLGFYDLRVAETRTAQADLARAHGVAGFLYWHYWFAGRRILERPFHEVLALGEPDFPFALAWANQTWSGIWHGAPDRVLLEQNYPGADDDRDHFASLVPAFSDHRYVTVAGRPLFYVFRPEQLPEPAAFVERWQAMATAAGFPGLYLVAEASGLLGGEYAYTGAAADGFDASVTMRLPADNRASRHRAMRVGRKAGLPEIYTYAKHPFPTTPDPRLARMLPSVYPNWDNTPRSGRRGLVLHGSTPARFRVHVRAALDAVAAVPETERFVFVKSWNEWAEGNHLEPDRRFGRGYLEVLAEELRRGVT
jgi:Glycosyltransferase WbsX